jgi:hypothetical protein
VANQQVSNQFGPERYALLFMPGTYGSSTEPLNFQVGYYTSVAGLGQSPDDVVINGSVYVRNQCAGMFCTALNNFWRSLSNLTINVNTPNFGCYNGEFWAVSQAAPMRRVHRQRLRHADGLLHPRPSFASGGFIADSAFDGSTIVNGSQQQWLVRNSRLDGWTNWGLEPGVLRGRGRARPVLPGGAVVRRAVHDDSRRSPVTREAPYLYVDGAGQFNVFAPSAQKDSAGTTWSGGQTPGVSIPIKKFFVATPSDSAATINRALSTGKTSS